MKKLIYHYVLNVEATYARVPKYTAHITIHIDDILHNASILTINILYRIKEMIGTKGDKISEQ